MTQATTTRKTTKSTTYYVFVTMNCNSQCWTSCKKSSLAEAKEFFEQYQAKYRPDENLTFALKTRTRGQFKAVA